MQKAEAAISQELEFIFDGFDLKALAEEQREVYEKASPFPYVVMDGFLPEDIAERVLGEFPAPDAIEWTRYNGEEQRKLESKSEDQLPPFTRSLLSQMNSSKFVSFLEELTGIEGLIPDPHYWGGGLHQINRGGHLKIHADFSLHPGMKIHRRINLLLYLNKDWKDEYAGKLELWDRDITRCEAKITPTFNRCVVFNTTDYSYHGHPDPVACPRGMTRKSIALYYYTREKPSDEVSATIETRWKERPDDRTLRSTIGRFIPPIVLDVRRAVLSRIRKN